MRTIQNKESVQIVKGSLAERAIIGKLSISLWQGNKLDKQVTEETQYNKEVKNKKAMRVYKSLFVDNPYLSEIVSIATRSRTWYELNSLPWKDNGKRLIPATKLPDTQKAISDLSIAFENACQRFFDNYYAEIDRIKNDKLLGKMFNEDDYPSLSEIKKKFAFSFSLEPIADPSDFRVQVNQSDLEKYAQSLIEIETEANKELWERLYKAVNHIVEKLNGDERLFESMITNVEELTEVIPSLNISGDSKLSRIVKIVKRSVSNIDIDDCRKDKGIRKETAEEIKDILNDMEGYF